jgi:hypothetical protein
MQDNKPSGPTSTRLTLSQAPASSRAAPQPRPESQPHPDAVVYLVQEPTIPKYSGKTLDVTPLIWWGKVRVLMERNQLASFRPAQARVQLRERLKDFNSEIDYISIAGGDTLAQVLVGATLLEAGHQFFNYLRFERSRLPDGTRDPSSGAYVAMRVPLTSDAAVMMMK